VIEMRRRETVSGEHSGEPRQREPYPDLSPRRNGPSAPTLASAAIKRKAPAGKAWPVHATVTGAVRVY
jgi:hypothetical protein